MQQDLSATEQHPTLTPTRSYVRQGRTQSVQTGRCNLGVRIGGRLTKARLLAMTVGPDRDDLVDRTLHLVQSRTRPPRLRERLGPNGSFLDQIERQDGPLGDGLAGRLDHEAQASADLGPALQMWLQIRMQFGRRLHGQMPTAEHVLAQSQRPVRGSIQLPIAARSQAQNEGEPQQDQARGQGTHPRGAAARN